MKDYYKILKSIALFEGISEEELQNLLECLSAKVNHYNKNQMIFIHGTKVKHFGIVLSGNVQVLKEDYYGNRSIVAMIDPGMLFAEAFAFAGIKKLPISVLATTECDILFIDYDKLITNCTKVCPFHNRIIYNMLHIIASKNIILSQKIEFLSKRSTREKLLAYLLAQAQVSGKRSFAIPFNRQELADYLSVDRSAMSQELGKLRDEGILHFHKNQFELI